MTISQINSTKTEFTFYGKDKRPRKIWSNNLLNAKKNHDKRFDSKDVKEIHVSGNIVIGNEFKLWEDGFKNWNLITSNGNNIYHKSLNKINITIC